MTRRSTHILERLTGWTALVMLLLLPFVVIGAIRALGVFSNDIKQWLPQGFEESAKYEWFVESFGLDEMAVVSWPGCTANDPRLEKLAHDLRQLEMESGQLVFDRVVTGPDIVAQLESIGWSHEGAVRRVTGLFVGPDAETTCLLAIPREELVRNRSGIVSRLVQQATATTGLTVDQLRLGGPTVDGAAIDHESKLALRQFLWMTLLVVFGLTWYRKRSFRLAAIIMVFSGYCAGLSLAILYYTGGTMNLTMIMLPTLVLILGVSASVHMVNYFLKALAAGGRIELSSGYSAGLRAIRSGGYPVLLATATTAVGMASLATSRIAPIKSFGLYSAAGVLASLPVVVLALSWVLNRATGWIGERHLKGLVDESQMPDPGRLVNGLAGLTRRFSAPIVVVIVLLVVATGYGIRDLTATVKVQNRFAKSTRIIQDYLWLENQLGPLVPMEIVVRVPPGHPTDSWQRMRLVALVEEAIRKNELINASWSAATFQPPVTTGLTGVRKNTADRLKRNEWEQNLPELERAGLVSTLASGEQLWRISLRIAAMNDIDYGTLLDQVDGSLHEQVDLLNQKLANAQVPPVSTVVTGAIPMMYKAQHQVFDDLLVSFMTAFGLIAITMMIVLRSVWAGLLAMLPNVFPPLIVFGIMGWFGTRIEIGSVMTASVALGISVDDTIHFLAWFRRGMAQGGSRMEGVRKAYAFCSRSMIDTTLICGLGVAPFMLSSFMPTVQFARLLLILLLVALVGDLVLLPAMLNGPLGRLFDRAYRKAGKSPAGPNAVTGHSSSESGKATDPGLSSVPKPKLPLASRHPQRTGLRGETGHNS